MLQPRRQNRGGLPREGGDGPPRGQGGLGPDRDPGRCAGQRLMQNSVAQWIAYQTSNLGVAGSSPVGVVGRLMDWTSEGYEFESHIGFTAVLGLLQDSVAEWLRR